MTFSPGNHEIRIRTYSPWLDQFETDTDSQFTVPYQMTPDPKVITVPSGSVASVVLTGLADSTLYDWFVNVSDGTDATTGPTWVFTTAALPPNRPTPLSATAIFDPGVDLAWTDNADNETAFEIERSASGSGGPFSLLATVSANATAYLDTSLVSLTEYCYRVRATNAVGSSTYSNVDCATTDVTQTVVFQEGEAGYVGTVDTYIKEASPDTDHGTFVSVEWDSDDPSGSGLGQFALVRFDSIFGAGPGQVPLGATISSATLTYFVSNRGDPANIHEVSVDWSEGVTYNAFGGDPGVQPDEYGPSIGTAVGNTTGAHSVDVTASVSAWANAPTQNRGWIFLPTASNGVDLRSSEYSTISQRPRLEVVYMAAPAVGAPTAYDDGPYSLLEEGSLTVIAPGVLGNDADPDGDPLTAGVVTPPANGILTLNLDGSFSYTPNTDFYGGDSYTYTASDGLNTSNVATVNLDVTAVNDAPVANDDSATTVTDTAVN